MLGKSNADMLRDSVPRLVLDRALKEMAGHSLDFWVTSEDLPHPDNRVTISSSLQITLQYTEHNVEGHRRLIDKLKGLIKSIEGGLLQSTLFVSKKVPLAAVAHRNGRFRFGSDPKTSVLDSNCKAHDLDNL